ncbi:MAG: aldehyde ferredoxin oxidoreductase N-terminal domain-containing protein, partial [Candidatus Hermodarchaeota archaeon]
MVWKRNIAYIDLSTGKITQKLVSKPFRKRFLGGRGINMYHLFHHIAPGIDPLSPDNALLIGTGLLTGIPALGAGRCDIAAKSPLTGAVGDSNIGGFFAPELRMAGFDHLVITG